MRLPMLFSAVLLLTSAGIALFLLALAQRQQLNLRLSGHAATLRALKAQSQAGEIRTLEERKNLLESRVADFKGRLRDVDELPVIEDSLRKIGAVEKVATVDYGEYRKNTYRVLRSEGPVSDWTDARNSIGQILESPGVSLGELLVSAQGDRAARRLSALVLEFYVFTVAREREGS